ncbi:MAG: helix-turn-helix transcriptional regulator [Marinifilaceae bacterium]
MNRELSITFGKVVKEIRKSNNVSQEELGYRSSLHRTYIGMIERGEKNITLENIDKISKGLGVSIKFLFEKFSKTII